MRSFRLASAVLLVLGALIPSSSPAHAATCKEAWLAGGMVANYDFTGCDLRAAIFVGVDLSGANFTNAKLMRANFKNSTLLGVNFTGANLTESQFTDFWNNNTIRHSANFTGANLTDANLTRAVLPEADFTNANLTRANFFGASLAHSHGTGIIGKPVGLSSLNKVVGSTWISIDYVGASITGTLELGKTLKANPSNYSDPSTIWTYQWSNGTTGIISKATKNTYTVTADDCGAQIIVQISSNVQGWPISDRPTATIPTCTMKPTSPKLSGTPKVNQTLKTTVLAWVKGAEISYQWLLDGLPIEGATSPSFKLDSSNKGHRISLRVTQTHFGFANAIATSPEVKIL